MSADSHGEAIKGWSALVTGGASGLGLAAAHRLIVRGAQVVVADLEGDDRRRSVLDIGGSFVATDVTDESQMEAAVAAACGLGPLRALVACAGIATPGRVLSKRGPLGMAAFDTVVRVNLSGTFNAIRLAAAAMAHNEPDNGDRGVIVTTASVAAFDGQVGQAAYSASKAAVAGMTLPLARDLASIAVRVVSIAPGMFETPLLAGLPTEAIALLAKQVPHPARLGKPREFGDLVGHILDNRMLNGEVIRLDGAIRMAP